MDITIPNALTVIIPLLVTALSHYLRDSKLSPLMNALIAFGAIVVTAIACVWLSTGWSGDFRAFTIAVLLYVGFLARNDFQAIMSYLFSSPSPIAQTSTAQGSTTVVASSGTFAYPVENTAVPAASTVPAVTPTAAQTL